MTDDGTDDGKPDAKPNASGDSKPDSKPDDAGKSGADRTRIEKPPAADPATPEAVSDSSSRPSSARARPPSEAERTPLRRKRPVSVIPELDPPDRGRESRRRMFGPTSPPEGEPGPVEGVRRKRRWLRRSDAPPPSDLADTEARANAARSAASALRSRLGAPSPASTRSVSIQPGSGTSVAEPHGRAPAPSAPRPDDERSLPARASSPIAADAASGRPDRSEQDGSPRSPTVEPAQPAIGAPTPRARRRPVTELAPPPVWQRQDLLVVAIALALFVTGAVLQRHLAAPVLAPVDNLGLHIARPGGWLPPRRVGRPTAGLASRADADGSSGQGEGRADPLPHHVVYQSATDPAVRLELRITERTATGNLRSALVLQRVSRHGEAHWAAESTDRTIAGRDWIRTQYRYAFKGTKSDSPRIATAIEYAILNGRLFYVVTLHGSDRTAALLEATLVPTLSIDANHPAAVERRR